MKAQTAKRTIAHKPYSTGWSTGGRKSFKTAILKSARIIPEDVKRRQR